MPHKAHQNTTLRDKTHKYLKFDYLTSLCVVDRICIFISSKMVAQYMYPSGRNVVGWYSFVSFNTHITKQCSEAYMYCAAIFELIKIQMRSTTQSEVR